MSSSRRSGFTLLEICLALLIGLLLITLSVPSIGGMLAEQRLKRTFEAFDAFVQKAHMKSVNERRTYVLVWAEESIRLETPEHRADDDRQAEVEQFLFEKGASISLSRPAALVKDPVPEWAFWASGTCEPVIVSLTSDAGAWSVRYDPLTVRGTFLESSLP